jgi:uncharacterized integral membrane protein
MRLFKLVVTLVILGLIALFVVQNMPTWTYPLEFKYKLPLFGEWNWKPGIELYLIMMLSALAGFFVGIGVIMKPYMRARRTLAQERQEKKIAAAAPVEVKEEQAKAS